MTVRMRVIAIDMLGAFPRLGRTLPCSTNIKRRLRYERGDLGIQFGIDDEVYPECPYGGDTAGCYSDCVLENPRIMC